MNAIQWTGENADEIQALVEHLESAPQRVCDIGDGFLTVGPAVLRLRDWIVAGVGEQLVHLRSDIFELMFEPAGEEPAHHLDPDGTVTMPEAFEHCATCGHWCNKCGACKACAPARPTNSPLVRRVLARVFHQ